MPRRRLDKSLGSAYLEITMLRCCFIFMTALAPFLFGCSPPGNESSISAHRAIQGAFGWTFGQNLPDKCSLQLDDTGVYCFTYETNGLFKKITVGVTADRVICMIEGHGDADSLDASDKETLIKALSDKYGLSDHAASNITGFGNVEVWKFGNGGSTAQLTVMGGTVTLLYRFDPTLETLQNEYQQKKSHDFQTNIRGI